MVDNLNVRELVCIVGTHIFQLGTVWEGFSVSEYIVTGELTVDASGFLCVILEKVGSNVKAKERIELLSLGYHIDKRVFLDRESAELERRRRLSSK